VAPGHGIQFTSGPLRTLEGHSGEVNSVAMTPDGKRALSASVDKTLKVWDLDTGRTLSTLEGHSGSVMDVALTADGKRNTDRGTFRVAEDTLPG
jgi:WD40 repeat protein